MVDTLTEQPAFDARYYPSADGRLTLFARDYPAIGDGGSSAPLLMMHGLTRNSADFEPLISKLGTNRRIIVPDQRGRGLSEYDPDPANYRPDIYVEDMWSLLGELQIDRVALIGTSMGGLMSMVMGAQQRNRIAGIVINDIGPTVSEAGLDRIRSYVGGGHAMANWSEAAMQCRLINSEALRGFETEDWIAFAKRTCTENPDCTVSFAYDPGIANSMEDKDPSTIPPDLWSLWDSLASIPIAVVRGADSDILSRDTLAEMGRRHRGMTETEIPLRGHAPILDEHEAVTAITEFIGRIR
ncbi:MAG: alpha/beta hydrolase [Pseudomonadota bacterium]